MKFGQAYHYSDHITNVLTQLVKTNLEGYTAIQISKQC